MTKQQKIIKECLNAVVNGPFIPDWEFATLFGCSREEVAEIYHQWPDVDMQSNQVKAVINNCFNNLTGYPLSNADKWPDFISVSGKKLKKIYEDWRKEFL